MKNDYRQTERQNYINQLINDFSLPYKKELKIVDKLDYLQITK